MVHEIGNPADNAGTSDLPQLRLQFDPTTLPSGLIGLKDAGDFISALQLYLVREMAVHPRREAEDANEQLPVRMLLVVPEPGSFIAQVIPVIESLPHLYASIQPTLIVIQRDAQALGQVLLWAGMNLTAGALQYIGGLAARNVIDKHRKAEASARLSREHQTTPNGSKEAPPSSSNDMLREVAKSLEISTNVLAWLLRYQLSREDPLLGDDLARKAIQTMDTVSNRPSLRQGSVAITIPETIAQRYDLNLYGPAIFDETTRRVLEHELSQMRPQEEHLAVAHGEPETVVGTVQGGPSYTREGFTLRHPLYGEVRCHLGPNLVGAGSHEAQPGTKVLVSGILYSPRKGQVPIMEVMSIRPVP